MDEVTDVSIHRSHSGLCVDWVFGSVVKGRRHRDPTGLCLHSSNYNEAHTTVLQSLLIKCRRKSKMR